MKRVQASLTRKFAEEVDADQVVMKTPFCSGDGVV